MTLDLDNLERLARAAAPGYCCASHGYSVWPDYATPAHLEYIAALSPDVALALIAEQRDLITRLRAAERVVEAARMYLTTHMADWATHPDGDGCSARAQEALAALDAETPE